MKHARVSPRLAPLSLALLAAGILAVPSTALQTSPPATRPAATQPVTPPATPPATPPPPAGAIPSHQPETILLPGGEIRTRRRTRLLREGSRLVGVVGTMSRTESGDILRFVIAAEDEQSPGYELTLMPCTLLDETEHMIASLPDHDFVFEVTAEVYVFHDRNFLLLTHPPLLVGPPPQVSIAQTAPAEEAPPGDALATDDPTATDEDSTEAIVRELERSVGPIARRPTGADLGRSASSESGLLREGTALLSRRGAIRRTSEGAFVFVFDADAAGLADPPLTLLPCLILERLERYMHRTGDPAIVLLSGNVHVYRNHNYLRPTVFRIPYQRTKLYP